MLLTKLADAIGAELRTAGTAVSVDLDQVFAGDRISDLLGAASDHALLVTNLASSHLVRLAELMDVAGICLVNRQPVDDTMLALARENGTTLMVSPVGLFETCGRIHAQLASEKRTGG